LQTRKIIINRKKLPEADREKRKNRVKKAGFIGESLFPHLPKCFFIKALLPFFHPVLHFKLRQEEK
jgi:hypothetical protein